jgi:hypothetical protein
MSEWTPAAGFTKERAEQYFAEHIKEACPDCKAPAGQLCDTGGVWLHLGRIKAYHRKQEEDRLTVVARELIADTYPDPEDQPFDVRKALPPEGQVET